MVPASRASASPAAMPAPARPLEVVLAELDALVGLAEVKAEVRMLASVLAIAQMRRTRHLPVLDATHHLVFTGNPGIGKTTVARLLAEVFRSLGVVSKGHLVETDRSQLVAGYVGQTAIQTREVVERAVGGVLLIDEAYALTRVQEKDYGLEAVDTLVKLMEDRRDDLVVIVTGYPDEMRDFVASNPGLQSRFTRTLHFADYGTDELAEIFRRLGDSHRYEPTADAVGAVRALLAASPRDRGFGNGRFVRNVFERAVANQARRLDQARRLLSDAELTTLEAVDIG